MAEQNTKKSDFFSYKGFPLVRNKDTIYYGKMSDPFVVMLQIIEKEKQGDLDVAKKVKLYQMATDENLSPIEAVVKQGQRDSLYEALDMAHVWLTRTSAE